MLTFLRFIRNLFGKPVDHSRSSFTDALSAARAGQVWDDSRSQHTKGYRA